MRLFGQSPFKPLQEHVRVVVNCANAVLPLFQAVKEENPKKVEKVRTRIYALENEADTIKNELRTNLPKSMFMPVDRRDLLEILDLQDYVLSELNKNIACSIKKAEKILGYKPEVALEEGMKRSIEWCIKKGYLKTG